MKKVLNKVVLGSLVIVVLLVGLFVVPYLANIVMPWDRADAIGTALRWGGLSELPGSRAPDARRRLGAASRPDASCDERHCDPDRRH